MRFFLGTLLVVLTACTPSDPVAEDNPEASEPSPVTVSGKVTYTGNPLKHPQADDAGLRRDLITVDADSKGLANTMVYLIPAKPWSSDAQANSPKEASIIQEDFAFLPGVLGVRVGQSIYFGNEDPANHNVRADSEVADNEFNVMTTREYGYDKTFQAQPDGKPIRLSCDIHAWMDGWVYVFDHPFFAVTNSAGLFTINDVPPGDYTLVIDQPDAELTARAEVTIKADADHHLSCEFTPEHLFGKKTASVLLGWNN